MEEGDLGRGFVHVFDETSLDIVMKELDTITDFVKYLADKEALLASGVRVLISGGEEDLLALYLKNGRSFVVDATLLVIDDTLWAGFRAEREYIAKNRLTKIATRGID